MIIVSGCPRSGTSLMSSILRDVVGADKFHGEKWPQEARVKRVKSAASEWELYVRDKQTPGWDSEAYKDLNPNGFWECPWTVKGVQRYDTLPTKTEGAKIVSQGLANSNPEAISRIIYMARHPRAVAKSQERLKRQFEEMGTVHSPEMYIQVHVAAARWIEKHNARVKVVDFDDLLEDPSTELYWLDEWLKELQLPGKFVDSVDKIQQKLRRSADQPTPEQSEQEDAWQDAEEIYELLLSAEFEEIAKYTRKKKDPHRRVFCTRLMTQLPAAACKFCLNDKTTRDNFKKTAAQRKIDWRNEPCIFECKENGISLTESIANNHWKNDQP